MQVDQASSVQTQPAPDPRISGLLEVLQSAASGNMLINPQGRVVYFGGQAPALLGLDPEAAVHQSVFDLVPVAVQGQLHAALTRALSGVTDPAFLYETELSGGRRRSVALQLSPIVENGAVLAVMTNVVEAASRQAANAGLHGDFANSSRLAEGSSLTIFHLDGRGQCTFMGEGWTRATGQPLGDALGTGWLLAIPEQHRNDFRSIAGAAHQQRHGWVANLQLFRTSGEVITTKAAASPVVDSQGQTVGYIGLINFEDNALESALRRIPAPLPSTLESAPPFGFLAPQIAVADPFAVQPTLNVQAPLVGDATPPPEASTLDSSALDSSAVDSSAVEVERTFEPPQVASVSPFGAATSVPAATSPFAPQPSPPHSFPPQPSPAQASPLGTAPLPTNSGQAAQSSLPAMASPGFSSEPVAPAPKFSMPATPAAGRNPTVQEGFTDPALLYGAKPEKVEEVVSSETPAVDKTTGLANKLLFAQHVQATTARMQADALTVSISFIDLHGLEVQKAAVGSRIANDYLFLLAKRLEATIRSIEIAGRIDGNILAVLSINWLFAEDLPVVSRRLLNKLSEPLAGKENNELVVAMNLGMAIASPNEDVNNLFRRAWEALQKSKVNGPGEFEIDGLPG